MYPLNMTIGEFHDKLSVAKSKASDNPSGLFDGGFRIIDNDSKRFLNKVVSDIGAASNTNEIKQAYLAYLYLGLSCNVSVEDILAGLYSNSVKNRALGIDPGKWMEAMLDNTGMIYGSHTKEVNNTMMTAAKKLTLVKKGSGVKVTLNKQRDGYSNLRNFVTGSINTDDIEPFLNEEYDDMIGEETQKTSANKPATTEQEVAQVEKKPEKKDMHFASAANTLGGYQQDPVPMVRPGFNTAGPNDIKFDANKFFRGSNKPRTVEANIPVKVYDPQQQYMRPEQVAQPQYQYAVPTPQPVANPAVIQQPQQTLRAHQNQVSDKAWISNPMNADLVNVDDTIKVKVIANHVKFLNPRDLDEESVNEFIRFITGSRFKSEMQKHGAKNPVDNPHIVEVPLEAYLRPGNEGKYDIAFKTETTSGRDLIILYHMEGVKNRKGKNKARVHYSAFFLN